MLNLNWIHSLRRKVAGRRQRRSLLAFGERLENRSMLTPFVVTSTEDAPDSDPGDGVARTAAGETTLRAAVEEANASSGVDSIEIPAGIFELTSSLKITDEVRLRGAGSGETLLDASQIDAHFRIESGKTLRLENLSLTGQEELAEGTQDADGLVELGNVTQSERPAGEAAYELLDPAELFLIGLAEAEAEEEAAFPMRSIEPNRTNPQHTDLLDTLFDSSTLKRNFERPLSEVGLAGLAPVSRLDIVLDRSPNFLDLAEREEDTPMDDPPENVQERDRTRTATNDPTDSSSRRKEVINSLFEQSRRESGKLQQTSGDEVENPQPQVPLSPVPLDEAGELLLKPVESERPAANRKAPPPLPEPGDENMTAIDVGTGAVTASVLMIVPAGWKQRLRKRLRYWNAVVS